MTADAPLSMLPDAQVEYNAVAPSDNPKPSPSTSPSTTPSAIDALRKDRDQSEEEVLNTLDEANDTEGKIKQTEYTTQETAIETMLKTKGYAETVAVVDENSARVTVNKKGLKSTDIAIIMDVIKTKTGYPATKIFISEI